LAGLADSAGNTVVGTATDVVEREATQNGDIDDENTPRTPVRYHRSAFYGVRQHVWHLLTSPAPRAWNMAL
jgi:hypothetical protein